MREYKCPHGALSVKVVGDIAQLSPLGVFRGELPWLIATLTEINGGQPEPEPAKIGNSYTRVSPSTRVLVQPYARNAYNVNQLGQNIDVDGDDAVWLAETLSEITRPEPEPAKKQVGGDHYARLPVEPWDVEPHWLDGMGGFQGHLAGTAIEYVMRHHRKGGVEDLKKAAHAIDRLIQHLEGRGK